MSLNYSHLKGQTSEIKHPVRVLRVPGNTLVSYWKYPMLVILFDDGSYGIDYSENYNQWIKDVKDTTPSQYVTGPCDANNNYMWVAPIQSVYTADEMVDRMFN